MAFSFHIQYYSNKSELCEIGRKYDTEKKLNIYYFTLYRNTSEPTESVSNKSINIHVCILL